MALAGTQSRTKGVLVGSGETGTLGSVGVNAKGPSIVPVSTVLSQKVKLSLAGSYSISA